MIKRIARHSFRVLMLLKATLLVLLVICILGIFILISSSQFLQFSVRALQDVLSLQGDTLVVSNLKGTLSNFSARKIELQTPTMSLDVESVHFHIHRPSLLLWEINIEALDAKAVRLTFRPELDTSKNTPNGAPSSWWKWLPTVFIQDFHIPLICVVFPNGRELDASLNIQDGKAGTQIEHFALSYLPLKLRLEHPVELARSPKGVTFHDLCLLDNAKNRVCLAGQWTDSHHYTLTAQLNVAHLGLLDDVFSDLVNTTGSLTGTLHLTAQGGNPIYSGELTLTDGSTYLVETGMHPEKLNATLKPEGNGLRLAGTGLSGDGKFFITGVIFPGSDTADTHVQTWGPRLLTLSLDGDNITVMNSSAGTLQASPHITYQLYGLVQTVSGTVLVTHASINGDHFRSAASDSEDVVFLSPSGKVEREPTHLLQSDLMVMLGDDVHFKGFGIRAALKGDLHIYSSPSTPILGLGKWTITTGEYETYGKKFTLQNGALLFNHSALSNPLLNVKAIYDLPQAATPGMVGPSSIQLGVAVTGTLEAPRFGFFSNPPMSQGDILSYIVLGTPMNKASANQQTQLSQAALAFALNNGDVSFLSDLKQTLGVDTLNVGTINTVPAENFAPENNVTGTNNTAVFIGKQLNTRLYISYGLGVFNQQQQFKTQYTLSRRWSFLTDTATSGNGADIVYTLNTGK